MKILKFKILIINSLLLILFFLGILNVQCSTDKLFSKNCLQAGNTYRVKRVFDGDTILIEAEKTASTGNKKNEYKIRFLGIDAFEHDQLPYGPKAWDFLTMLVLNKKVCIETDVQEQDRYGRTLGYVFLVSKSVNEELLRNGQALLYDFPPNIKYIDKLKKAETYARKNMLGVWEKQDYIAETPAQWRHKHPHKYNKKKHKTN